MSTSLTLLNSPVDAPELLWDTVWDGFVGDWTPASPSEPSNMGGLRATAQLETAILLCLMSDARAAATDAIPDGSGDPRGWVGDAVDDSIDPLGSKWWLLRRHTLDDATGKLACVYAADALQTLITQGAVASFSYSYTVDEPAGILDVAIGAYKQDGTLIVSKNFSILWEKNRAVHSPLSV